MNSIVVAVVIVCVWLGAQNTTAVPHHVPVHGLTVQKDPPSARFLNLTIIKNTITKTMFETVIVNVSSTWYTCKPGGVDKCPEVRSIGVTDLPIDAPKTAQPDLVIKTAHISKDQESNIEFGQLLLPSYINEECFIPKGRILNWIASTQTVEKDATLTLTNTILMGDGVSLSSNDLGTEACIPTDYTALPDCP